MGLGMIIGGIEAAVGVVTLNPALILDGGRRAATSYVIGEVMSPITEPIKDAVGEVYSDVDWTEVAETCPFW